MAHAIAGQLDVLLVEVPATELIAGVSGESEERIREIFEQAASFAPCVLFIDEIDAISSNRQTAQKDMERRIVAQLLSSIDSLSKLKYGDQVLVIGATNRADALDPALRRVGRFDHEISLGIPDRPARAQILEIICRHLKLEQRPFDFDELASLTPGYVGADLLALATRAASTAIKRAVVEREQKLLKSLTNDDKNEKSLSTAAAFLEPIVNLEEDDLLMDVDTEASKDEEKTTTTTDVAVADNDGGEKKVEESSEATEKTNEVDADKVAAKEAESTTELPESTVTIEKPMETDEEMPKIADPEPAKIDESNTKTEITQLEPPSQEKLQLTLDNMLQWLNNDCQLMSDLELERLAISRDDFLDAIKHVQPSAKREGFITVPDVTWNDIGSLQDIRSELKLAVLAPVKFPKKLEALGISSPSGVLLCGNFFKNILK